MADIGILGFGAYVPINRLQRSAIHAANNWFAGGLGGLAKGEKAITSWDEDVVTMAVEAARDCLAETDRATITGVYLASTTHPFADRQNAGIVKEALNLRDNVAALDVGGSQRAGTSSLLAALHSVQATGGTVLHCAAERALPLPASEREMHAGDAAAALLVGAGEPIAVLQGAHSVTVDFVDHFRETGQSTDYDWESRWVREEGFAGVMGGAIIDALAKFGIDGTSIDHFIAPVAVRGVPEMLARKAGIRPEAVADGLVAMIGHAGAAHATLMLAAVLEKARPGETILLTSFGQGCDVMLFTAAASASSPPRLGVAGWLARRREDTNYMRYLAHRDLVALDRGMRAEHDQKQPLTSLWRERKAVLALVGGRCSKTGTVQFPKTEVSVNQNDRAIGTQEDYPLAERPARVMTYTADTLTYSPDPPSVYGNIEFEGGGRLMAEFIDIDPARIEVGDEMRMMFRIKSIDELRHFRRYFWKAAPSF